MTEENLLEGLAHVAARHDVLTRVAEFRELDASGFATLATHAIPELHQRGDVLWGKGDLATDFLVVVEGNLMPRLASVAPVQAHQTVGLLPLFAMEEGGMARRTGDIVVTSPTAVVLRVHYQTLVPWLRPIALDVARLFARHLASTDEALAYL